MIADRYAPPASVGSRIRVLYVINGLNVGGTERQLVELVRRLDRGLFDPTVCCLEGGGGLVEVLGRASVPVVELTRGGRPSLAAVGVGLYRLMRGNSFDIVHAYLFRSYVSAALVARSCRVPVVITSRRSLGKFKEGHRPALLLERVANRVTNLVLANSEAVRTDVLRQERLPAGKVRVVHNGIPVDGADGFTDRQRATARKEMGAREDTPVCVVVANLLPYKGHAVLLECAAEVRRRFPEAQFWLVGDGPLRSALQAEAFCLGVADRVRFLGLRHDVSTLLRSADLAVLPSWEEGSSNAVLEAMLAGLPVVATAVGGNVEAVIDGETGFLVPPGEASELASAIIRITEQPTLAKALGQAGRRRVVEKFSVDRMVSLTQDVYEELRGARDKVR